MKFKPLTNSSYKLATVNKWHKTQWKDNTDMEIQLYAHIYFSVQI